MQQAHGRELACRYVSLAVLGSMAGKGTRQRCVRRSGMPITALVVTLNVTPLSNPCPPGGAAFTVRARVTANAGPGARGNYDVRIFDHDPLVRDLLAQSLGNPVGPGITRTTHTWTFICNDACEVIGPSGSSGESDPAIYAEASALTAATAQSGRLTLRCGESPPADGGKQAQRAARPGRRAVQRPATRRRTIAQRGSRSRRQSASPG